MANSVAKVIEVSCSSTKSFDDAMATGLKKVSKSVKGIQGAWVHQMKVVTSGDGKITEWRVNMKVSFVVQ